MVLFTELLGDNLGNLVNALAFVHVAAVVTINIISPPAAIDEPVLLRFPPPP